MSGLIAVGYFLFASMFSLLAFLLWTRIALRYFRINPLHSISRTILSLTNPIIMPLAMMFGKPKAPKSRYDWPCFCVLVMVELLKFVAIGALFLGPKLPLSFVPLYTLADLIVEPCNLLFYALIIRVLLSFINPTWQHPAIGLLQTITEPLIRLGRLIIPNMSGFDFAPLFIMVSLRLITIFISASLPMHLI